MCSQGHAILVPTFIMSQKYPAYPPKNNTFKVPCMFAPCTHLERHILGVSASKKVKAKQNEDDTS